MLNYEKIETDSERIMQELKEIKTEHLSRCVNDKVRDGLFEDLVDVFGLDETLKIAPIILNWHTH